MIIPELTVEMRIPELAVEPSKKPTDETKIELDHMHSMAEVTPAKRSILQYESNIRDLKSTITSLKENLRDLRNSNRKTESDKRRLIDQYVSEKDNSKIVLKQKSEIIELRANNIVIGAFTGIGGGLISSFPRVENTENLLFYIGWIFLSLAFLCSFTKEIVCFFVRKFQPDS